jgi:hypothetical protein
VSCSSIHHTVSILIFVRFLQGQLRLYREQWGQHIRCLHHPVLRCGNSPSDRHRQYGVQLVVRLGLLGPALRLLRLLRQHVFGDRWIQRRH